MLLDGYKIATKRNEDLKKIIAGLGGKRPPSLAIILVGNNAASLSYIKGKIAACEKVGITPFLFKLDCDISESELSAEILRLNKDPNIDGIILQLPLPKSLNESQLLNLIDFNKDVDGFHIYNKGKLFKGEETLYPATPKGIINLLEEYQIDVSGMNAVIIGRSNIVGMPLFKMLVDKNATVTICHSKTKNLKEHTKMADLLVVAIGKPQFIDASYIKKGAIVIDVGINKIDGKLYGDVLFASVFKKSKYLTPVPKGIGPMTINAILENTLKIYQKKQKI